MSLSPLIDSLEPRRLLANLIIDPTFGAGGYTAGGLVETFVGTSGDGVMTKLTIERNDFTSYQYRRYLADGRPDPAFTPIKQSGYGDWEVTTDGAGRLLIGKSADNAGVSVTRYDLTGVPDESFGKNGVSTFVPAGSSDYYGSTRVLSVATGPDQSVYILAVLGAYFQGSVSYAVIKLKADGSVDTRFGDHGTALAGEYDSSFFDEGRLLIDSLGRPHAIVPRDDNNANPKNVLRLTAAGQLDKTFQAIALPTSEAQRFLALDTKGRVLIPLRTTVSGQAQFQVARFNEAGRPDQSFGVAGVATPFAEIYSGDPAIVPLPDGTVDVQYGGLLGRLNENGAPVRRGLFAVPYVFIRAMGRDGRLIAEAEVGLNGEAVTRLVATPFAYVAKNGTLTITGSNVDDAFSLRPSGPAGRVLVGYNGGRLGLFSGVKAIRLTLDSGDDAVSARTVTQPMVVNGDAGNDTIATGLATDSIDLGDGSNAVDAGPGGGVIKAVWNGPWTEQPALNVVSAPGLARDRWQIDIASGRSRINATGRSATVAMGSHSSVAVLNFSAGVTVVGTAGNDSILTGRGNDKILPGDGRDTVDTGAGDDLIDASSRTALVYDDDRYVLGPGNDLVFDLFGRSTLLGGDGDDTATIGTAGDDLSSVEHVTRKST